MRHQDDDAEIAAGHVQNSTLPSTLRPAGVVGALPPALLRTSHVQSSVRQTDLELDIVNQTELICRVTEIGHGMDCTSALSHSTSSHPCDHSRPPPADVWLKHILSNQQ